MTDKLDNEDEFNCDEIADRVIARTLSDEECRVVASLVRHYGKYQNKKSTLKASGREIALYMAMSRAFGTPEKVAVADAAVIFGAGKSTVRQYAKDFREVAVQPLASVVDAMEKLRPFFTEHDIRIAIQGYVAAGGRQLAGVRIFPVPC